MNTEEFIATLKPDLQPIAQAYIPILSRWAADAGWDSIRSSLYARLEPSSWYRAVRKRMTPTERDADDKRAKEAVRLLSLRKSELIARERNLLQQVVTLLIPFLLAHL
jgi:hypothetical protein